MAYLKMKRILTILSALLLFCACDPIYVGELRNNTKSEIEIKVCGQNLSYVNNNNSGKEIPNSDTIKNCKTIRLDRGKTMPIVTASGIAKPIIYEDLGFNEIEVITENGQIHATGQAIMNLFKIEERTNFIGIHSSDLYLIDIGYKGKN